MTSLTVMKSHRERQGLGTEKAGKYVEHTQTKTVFLPLSPDVNERDRDFYSRVARDIE
jgi:hypothetical protein